jgi:hypothetical protein
MAILHYSTLRQPRRPLPDAVAFLALPLLWVAAFLPFWEFTFPLALLALALLASRRRWLPLLLLSLLFSPFTVAFAMGVSDYATGTGHLKFVGLTRGIVTIDRDTRLEEKSIGDTSLGNEWMRLKPYNAALRCLATLCGPMKGSYTGPFPDKAAAYAAIAAAPPIDLRQMPGDLVTIPPTPYPLAPGTGRLLLQGFPEGPATDVASDDLLRRYGPARAVIYKTSLLILAIPAGDSRFPGDTRVLILIDLVTGRPIANYHDQPSVRFRRYVNWR